MPQTIAFSRRLFLLVTYTLLILLALLCILPIIHVLAISLSSSSAVNTGMVKLWPVDFTLRSYRYILDKPEFLRSVGVSCQRVLLGGVVQMLLTLLVAYPLSKEPHALRFRTVYVWLFVFTMLFSGGLIPTYMTVKETGLLGSLWSLVLPEAVPVFNVILMLNFFRALPKELEESAFIDGAGHWRVLFSIIMPLSLPSLATVGLFTIVHHWNAWFDGMIFMNTPNKYPLSTYLQTVVINQDIIGLNNADLNDLLEISDRTAKAAQIFLGSVPILLVYPFLQRYFLTGITLGSVKE